MNREVSITYRIFEWVRHYRTDEHFNSNEVAEALSIPGHNASSGLSTLAKIKAIYPTARGPHGLITYRASAKIDDFTDKVKPRARPVYKNGRSGGERNRDPAKPLPRAGGAVGRLANAAKRLEAASASLAPAPEPSNRRLALAEFLLVAATRAEAGEAFEPLAWEIIRALVSEFDARKAR